jgi:hypothetical protein
MRTKNGRPRRDVGAQPKCNNGIRDKGLKQQLRLGRKGNINEALRQTIVLEIVELV